MAEDTFYAKDRESWRSWLKDNHLKENKIAVIRYKKHTGKSSPSHLELMHDAICFGWIDTAVKRLDGEKYLINFRRRTDKGRWSNNTLSYAKRMIREKKMFPEGLRRYKEGMKKGPFDNDLPANPEMIQELQSTLALDSMAMKNFNNFAPSYKRMLLRWILRAKQETTREKRILNVVSRAKKNIRSW